MRFVRNALLSLQILAARRLRTALSLSGITTGVAAVILMVSVGRGAEKQLLDRIRAMGTNLLVVNAAPARMVAGRQRQSESTTTLFPADARRVEEACPRVLRASPAVRQAYLTTFEGRVWKTQIVGLTETGLRIRNIPLRAGRGFDDEDELLKRRVAVLGPTVVESLFGRGDPLGQTFQIGRVPFEVVGVAEPRGLDAGGTDQDDVILIPLGTAMRRLMNVNHVHAIFVEASGPDEMDRAEAEIREVLRERRTAGAQDFTIQSQAELRRTQRETSASMTFLIASSAGFALLVGGVGILAVMILSVRERTREIGLRRALGARRRDIAVQFLMEAGLLAVGGGALGIAAGTGAALLLPALGGGDTLLSWPPAVAGLAASLLVGIASGVYPALRASRLDPIRALQAE